VENKGRKRNSHRLWYMDMTLFQRAMIRRDLIQHEEDCVSRILEDSMRYTAMVGWMVFDQMATMNERIPLYGDGSYEQLQGDVVEHNERLEEIKRRYGDVDAELNQMSDRTYHWVVELEGRVENLEGTVVELRLALH
jgi:hypothetical protein